MNKDYLQGLNELFSDELQQSIIKKEDAEKAFNKIVCNLTEKQKKTLYNKVMVCKKIEEKGKDRSFVSWMARKLGIQRKQVDRYCIECQRT